MTVKEGGEGGRERRWGREAVYESCEKPFACFDFLTDVVYQLCIVHCGSNVHTGYSNDTHTHAHTPHNTHTHTGQN